MGKLSDAMPSLLVLAGWLSACATGSSPSTGETVITTTTPAPRTAWGVVTRDVRQRFVHEDDGQLADQTLIDALDNSADGTPILWKNPSTGHSGSVTPVRTYENREGQRCRTFNETATVDGNTLESSGAACRLSDGSWEIGSP